MTYGVNGKTYNVPEKEIDKLQKKLDISFGEAVDVWLTDNGLKENEEQELLNSKAKTAPREKVSGEKGKPRKPRTVKISDEKQLLFKFILNELRENFQNVDILTENKLIEVEINEKTFKINISENRKAKK